MSIVTPIRETRNIASVLSDMILGSDLSVYKSTILREEVLEDIRLSKRFVIGQLVMITTVNSVGAKVTSTPAIVTGVEGYQSLLSSDVKYKVKLLLGALTNSTGISNEVYIDSTNVETKVITTIPAATITYLQESLLALEDIQTFKEVLNIPHVFYMDIIQFKSMF